MFDHLPVKYREQNSPYAQAVDVCDTCSELNEGLVKIVPIDACPAAKAKDDEYFNYLAGRGPRPEWLPVLP